MGCVCDERSSRLLPGHVWVEVAWDTKEKLQAAVRKARDGLAKVQRENRPVLGLERTCYLCFFAAFNVIEH